MNVLPLEKAIGIMLELLVSRIEAHFMEFVHSCTLTLLSSSLVVWFQAGLGSTLSKIHLFWRASVNAYRLSNTKIQTQTQTHRN